MRKMMGLVIASVAGLVIAAFLVQVFYYAFLIKTGKMKPEEDAQRSQFQASLLKTFNAPERVDLSRIEAQGSPTLGNPAAKVHIVEFVDYGCPFCKQVASVIREYVATHPDDAYLVIRDFPITELHPQAENVAIAAHCVFRQSPNAYWKYFDLLFANQQAQTPDDLRSDARSVGVDLAKWDTCVVNKEPLSEIRVSVTDGLAAGVDRTPTFFFNGVKIPGVWKGFNLETFGLFVEQASNIGR